ncbi:hypothetical protein KQ51_01485 [Candidatus Izimaplasma bacterium HR1]|uniref:hypothetical protein n=1 Tax=Candidatus Izimoplasma sp. HR1 TaxID=1541959 RepID=UPI0004F8BB77|nr:hypothetical protein KQ51_01485 [Candidatus Izimaplasma bacterium HR1]
MKSNKHMYMAVGIVFVLFTISQIFYFAQVRIVPFSTITISTLINITIYLAEVVLFVGLSIIVTYILPIICIFKLSPLFIGFRNINIPIILVNGYVNIKEFILSVAVYKRLQVIRC